MRKSNFGYILILLLSLSCSAEKINLSPVGGMSLQSSSYSYSERKNLIVYSSEISNLISSFPKFKNDAVNLEVVNLKYHLKDYIGAIESYNINGLNNAQRNFEKSYKKLQKLRKYLNADDDQVLNRYLVRIKTNMTFLESNISKDPASIK
ncbi:MULTISPECIES: hypothetical protein [unclassified Kaistella]|uniref:hypothetical protein n=1 Tax=unclassified Kaistella TaxID=2762626 RepID=UPI0027340DCE|nr:MULTISPECIES: hypothetical protein [unclassified Kaistella]MCZ2082999.1 hypothetical protein [Flavobacteriales bacterium]MDP2452691.1 hypothetical protein [Kaistella sp. SH11-4b]MDP2455600.1 hypothetical protein [Kaistella sp. SH40-3]MDP2458504.1 hypothetical protein [Kaistella sp. SH19-2b]